MKQVRESPKCRICFYKGNYCWRRDRHGCQERVSYECHLCKLRRIEGLKLYLGTADRTRQGSEMEPSTCTRWVQPIRKGSEQERSGSLIPMLCILEKSTVWSSLSKTLEKSRRISSTWLDLLRLLVMSQMVVISWDSQFCFCRKPYWKSVIILLHSKWSITVLWMICSRYC